VAIKPSPHKKSAEIGMLSVSPKNQGSGLGTFLMNYAMEYAKKELGAEEIEVGIVNIRERLIKYYEKMGFKNYGETCEFHSATEQPTVPVHMCILKRPPP
jgi:ribosomal protein S18 acetylase RimI-like enzyme